MGIKPTDLPKPKIIHTLPDIPDKAKKYLGQPAYKIWHNKPVRIDHLPFIVTMTTSHDTSRDIRYPEHARADTHTGDETVIVSTDLDNGNYLRNFRSTLLL